MSRRFLRRDGRYVADLKIVTRDEDSVAWFRKKCDELEVTHGALFDTLVKLAKDRSSFDRQVKATWHDRYAV